MDKIQRIAISIVCLFGLITMIAIGGWIQDPSDTDNGSSVSPAGTPYMYYAWEGNIDTNGISFTNSYERVCYLSSVNFDAYAANEFTLTITVGAGSNTYTTLSETANTLTWILGDSQLPIEKGEVLTFSASGTSTNTLYYRIRR